MQFLHLVVPAGVMAAETVQVRWTTDGVPIGYGTYGPDGPWQALEVSFSNGSSMHYLESPGEFAAMWPSGGARSMVLTRGIGRDYTVANSSTAVIANHILSTEES